MNLQADRFRQGMRRLAAGVCIITTASEDDGRWGATATAVCSVCADPPTLLCCLNRRSSTHDAIRASGRFAINVLAQRDRDLADRFASALPSAQKFENGTWLAGATGAPLLQGAAVSFDCRLLNAVDVGTHGIFFGQILDLEYPIEDERPLLYAGGGYGGFMASH